MRFPFYDYLFLCKFVIKYSQMKKFVRDMLVSDKVKLNDNHVLITLTNVPGGDVLPEMVPGQFVQVLVEGSPDTFLRRPISINDVDYEKQELSLLIQKKGKGTECLMSLSAGDKLNLVFPLGGRGFTFPAADERILLVGGGVGVAPLLFFGRELRRRGAVPTFLLGAKSADMLLERGKFEAIGNVYITTEDGSAGEMGFVTQHSLFEKETFQRMVVCGPAPMMKAVAGVAQKYGIECEVSLENMMACGVGACLCCVEKTTRGNVCVCQDGPVFNINELTWLN